MRVLRFAIKSDPGFRDGRSTTQRVYSAYAVRYMCPCGVCRATESVRYRVVVEFKGFPSYWRVRLNRAAVGVMTAYCEMPNRGLRCPHWVDQSIGATPLNPTGSSSPTAMDGGTADVGFSEDLRYPLPAMLGTDGSWTQQYVGFTATAPEGFVDPENPLGVLDGNDPWYDGDDEIVCGQCSPDDGT